MTARLFRPPIPVSESPVCGHPNPDVEAIDTTLETFTAVTYSRFGRRPKAVSFTNPEQPGFHLTCGCVVPGRWMLVCEGGQRDPFRAWFEANR